MSDALRRGGRVVMTAPATVAMMVVALQAGCQSTAVRLDDAPATLHITVLGITPGRGAVRCALYADRATFLTRGGITEGLSVPATADRAEFELHAHA